MNKTEKALAKEKKIECIIGVIFLIPPILGSFFFLLSLCDVSGDFVNMKNLYGQWNSHYDATPVAPIYLGLMAIAGAYMVKNSFRYLFMKEEKVLETLGDNKQQ